MKSTITLILMFTISSMCFGQVNYFSKRYYINEDLEPFDFALNDANGTIVVGKNNTYNSFCSYQNEDGVPIWSRKFVPQQGYMELKNVIRLYDSTFLLVGTMKNPLTGKHGAACIRMDQFGDTLWTKTIDNISLETIPHDVIQLKDSNILVTGSIHGTWSFAFKLDLDGNKIWGKTYNYDGSLVNWTHEIIAVKEHDNGQLIFAGRLIDQNSGTSVGRRGFVMKTESNGEVVWVKSLYRTGEYVYLDDVIIEDSFYYFLNSASSDIIKTDSSLNIIWSTQVAWPNQAYDEKRSITVLHDSTMLVTWYDMSNGYIQRINQNGNVIDAATIFGRSIRTVEDNDSSILILNEGPTYGLKSIISQNHFGIYKLDSLLNSPMCVFENTPWSELKTINISSNSIIWDDPLDIYNTTFAIEDLLLINEVNCVEMLGGLDESDQIDFEVFPNPFTNQFVIRKNNDQISNYILFDCSGRILIQGSLSSSETEINTDILSVGNYFVQVEGIIQKIIKN